MAAGSLEKDDARDMINLANTRVPKYAVIILLLEVIAHTLGQNRIS